MAEPTRQRPAAGRALPIALVLLAGLIGLVSVFALWVKRQALETETWTETSSELLQNEAISDAVADFIVDSLFTNVDVESEVAAVLPPNLQPLAGPATGGLRQLTTRVAEEALQRPRVQALWEDANRAAHEKLIAVIDDEGEFVSTGGGVVTLDLAGIIGEVVAAVGLPASLTDKLPPQASELEILRADELEAAQTGVKALRAAAWILTALTLILFALAIYLARGRRRETLRAVGIAFIAIGALVLLIRNAAGNGLTDALTGTAAAAPPVDATWEISTSLLLETAQSLIAYGVVIVLAAWLAGPTAYATALRRWVTPYLRQPRIAYGGLAVLLALLFWWDPVVATHRVVPSLLLIAFAVIGTEALRRQVIGEFPDAVATHSPEGVAQALRTRMRESREARVASAAATTAPAAADTRLEALERLARLREAGVLTDEELSEEKRRIVDADARE